MGTIGALKKEKNRLNPSNPLSAKYFPKKAHNQMAILEEIKNETKSLQSNSISFHTYPWIGWGLGILMAISGLYLIYHISLGKYGSFFQEFREGYDITHFI